MKKSIATIPALCLAAGALFGANMGQALASPMKAFATTAGTSIEKILCKQGGPHCTPKSTNAKVPSGPKAVQIPGSGWQDPDCKEFNNCGYAGADTAKGKAPVKAGTASQNK
ncbi:MAG TPA: hypothetical protein VFA15_00260 [Nitrososphaera sp.]|nr:hypothetical protein [Nitrososphaera sp.]